MTNQELGILGENMATLFLQKKGHKIRARNFVYLRCDELRRFENSGEHSARELPSYVAMAAADTFWDTLLLIDKTGFA